MGSTTGAGHGAAAGPRPVADAVCLALGITGEGRREVVGLWIADTEGAKFRLAVMTELRNRGVRDVPIAVVDAPRGFPEAVTAAFPETTVPTPGRGRGRALRRPPRPPRPPLGSNFCSWKGRRAVAAGLREACAAETAEAARDALEALDATWGRRHPSIARAWRRAWEEVIPFFASHAPRAAA